MICPACGRKLLSQASACCNWCGETIADPEFQAHASIARTEYFAHLAAHDAASLLALESLSGPVIFSPPPVQIVPPVPPPAEIVPSTTTEQDDARERFRHLEL